LIDTVGRKKWGRIAERFSGAARTHSHQAALLERGEGVARYDDVVEYLDTQPAADLDEPRGEREVLR